MIKNVLQAAIKFVNCANLRKSAQNQINIYSKNTCLVLKFSDPNDEWSHWVCFVWWHTSCTTKNTFFSHSRIYSMHALTHTFTYFMHNKFIQCVFSKQLYTHTFKHFKTLFFLAVKYTNVLYVLYVYILFYIFL